MHLYTLSPPLLQHEAGFASEKYGNGEQKELVVERKTAFPTLNLWKVQITTLVLELEGLVN